MVDNFAEFRKQYEGTFIRVKFESANDYCVVVVSACIDDDIKHPYIVVSSPSLKQCAINWEESKQTIDYSFPTVGLFNFNNTFQMFCRLPDRQFKRGILSSNSLILDPFYDIKIASKALTVVKIKPLRPDHSNLTSAFDNKFPTSLDQAVQSLNSSEQLGVALNPIFGLSKNPTVSQDIILWKHLNMIGTLSKETKTIEVIESIFQQEVVDFLKRQKEFIWNLK